MFVSQITAIECLPVADQWSLSSLQCTPAGFLFHFKIFAMFAQQQIDEVGRLPFKIREILPDSLRDRQGPILWKELTEDIQAALWHHQNESLRPAIEANKLGS
jgi:hypothetical protein